MADFTYNIAKGRIVEYYNRVKSNDPSASALILIPLTTKGTEAQGQDFDTVAAAIDGVNFVEAGAAWGRKTLTDTELAALPAPDDTNNRYAVQVPSVTWTSVAAGNNTTGLLVAYDSDTAAGTDSNLIPLTCHDFAVTTDGNNVVLNVGDFLRAS